MAGTGGKRPGAGRKTNAVKALVAGFTAPYFDLPTQQKKWKSLLNSEDEKIVLDATKYLTDRLYGKAPQSMDMTSKGDAIQFIVTRSGNTNSHQGE